MCGTLVVGALASPSPEPVVPARDSDVLLTLPKSTPDAERELLRLRRRLGENPEDPGTAAQIVTHLIARSRSSAEPRLLGQAQAVLGPWWFATHAPAEILVLRATIKQSLHQFEPALLDLQLAVRTDPGQVQAWRTGVAVHMVRAEYRAARRALLHLARLDNGLITLGFAATLGSLTGRAEASYETLRQAVQRGVAADVEDRAWCESALGEIAARLGHSKTAEEHFARALSWVPADTTALAGLADLQLDTGRAAEVIPLLGPYERVDNLLLRLALAEAKIARSRPDMRARLERHVDEIRARFELGRQRGDSIHTREEARFSLFLMNDADRALELACRNWHTQREPSDARILLESALASHRPGCAGPALAWFETNHVEDVWLGSLAARLKPNGGRAVSPEYRSEGRVYR